MQSGRVDANKAHIAKTKLKKSDTESDFFYDLYFSDSPQQVAERYSVRPYLDISQ